MPAVGIGTFLMTPEQAKEKYTEWVIDLDSQP